MRRIGLLALRKVGKRLLIRLRDYFTCRAVDQQQVAVRDLIRLLAGTDNRRNAHRTRHDRRMARAAADLRDKTGNRLAADLCRIGRCKVVRHNNARLSDRVNRVVRNTLQILNDPLRNITDVCCTRLHIFVVERAEHRLKVLAVDKARVLRANLLIRYNVCHTLDKIRVVEHHQMRVKNFRLSRTDILFRIVTQHFDLLLGFFHCVENALAFGFRIGNGLLNDRKIFFLDNESLCLRQTLRNADSLEFNHGVFLRFYDCIFIQISQPNLYYIVQHPYTFVKQIKFFLQTDIYFWKTSAVLEICLL